MVKLLLFVLSFGARVFLIRRRMSLYDLLYTLNGNTLTGSSLERPRYPPVVRLVLFTKSVARKSL